MNNTRVIRVYYRILTPSVKDHLHYYVFVAVAVASAAEKRNPLCSSSPPDFDSMTGGFSANPIQKIESLMMLDY